MKKKTNEFQLMESIIEMSLADNFQEAKLEWILVRIYKQEGGSCLCGHNPILNHCVLKNKNNHKEVIVGSSCVQKFIGLQTEVLFKSYSMIVKDIESSMSEIFIRYLFDKGIINEWERDFLLSTERFEWLTEKQKNKRLQINQRVIDYMRGNQ